MNVYDGKHWNIYEILPYQRRFNFINGPRSLGKTYTTQMFLLDKAIHDGKQFVYFVRTQDEKKNGVLADAFRKVIQKEFPYPVINEDSTITDIDSDTSTMYLVHKEGDKKGKVLDKRPLGYCLALSEAYKLKKKSFPDAYYGLFDEYMLEGNSISRYVGGWKEPDLLLSLYHTIDREEDRLILFLHGNNVKFYNPYHMHSAFSIPETKPGTIWTSKNVLYQNAIPSATLKKEKEGNAFLQMVDGTNYGRYAKDGVFMDDSYSFLHKLTNSSRYIFTLVYEGESFGVYADYKIGYVIVSDKIDPSCIFNYALTLTDHRENTLLTKGRCSHLSWLSHQFKMGSVRFTSMKVKTIVSEALKLIL